jgi:hypothetical protein
MDQRNAVLSVMALLSRPMRARGLRGGEFPLALASDSTHTVAYCDTRNFITHPITRLTCRHRSREGSV